MWLNSPLSEGDLDLEQRKAPSRPSVRNMADITPPEPASQSQIGTDLPSARPKRARIATKLEKEEPTSVEPVSREITEPVSRVPRHERNDVERVCRLLPDEAENLGGKAGHAGSTSKLLRKSKRRVQRLWFNTHLLHTYRQTHLYLLYRNLFHRHQLLHRLLRNPWSNPRHRKPP